MSGFYETCAQIEIDEFQNYEKALAALVEAENIVKDGTGTNGVIRKQEGVRMFLEAQRMAASGEYGKSESICIDLLNQDSIEVRMNLS